MSDKELIGLSMSGCVLDIIQGRVALNDVTRLITGTACATPDNWNEAIARYRQLDWANNPDEGERIARHFIERDLVDQPRLRGEDHNIPAGRWLRDGVIVHF